MQEYIDTDTYLHYLSQNIAKVNITCLPKKDDDSHTTLSFDPVYRSLAGRWITRGEIKLIFALDLLNSRYVWRDEYFSEWASISFEGKTESEVEAEINESIVSLFPEKAPLVSKLHFEIPEYGYGKSVLKAVSFETIMLWADCRRLANDACLSVLHALHRSDEIRIWPHHFDTGVYVDVNDRIGIGFGLAMADSMSESPYFYLSGYPKGDSLNFDDVPDLLQGEWIVNDSWKGAILSIMDIDAEYSSSQLNVFLHTALQWYLHHGKTIKQPQIQ